METYEYFGTFRNADARLILDEFVKRDIQFDIEIDDSAIRNMTGLQMLLGGTFGSGSRISISVLKDDLEEAANIRKDLFGPEE